MSTATNEGMGHANERSENSYHATIGHRNVNTWWGYYDPEFRTLDMKSRLNYSPAHAGFESWNHRTPSQTPRLDSNTGHKIVSCRRCIYLVFAAEFSTLTMGRITLFTADDLNSTAAKLALDARDLPYLEINFQQYPQKKKDLMNLAGTLAVPQAFFNTRLVGDLTALQLELKGWDTSTKYKSARARFEKEILHFPDPINFNLALPDTDPVPPAELPEKLPSTQFELPDKTNITVSD
jgi:hypothetical protein